MALEIVSKTATPTAGGYASVNVQFTLRKGTGYLNGGLDLPGEFATKNDAETLEEVRRQLAIQMYEGEATPALVAEYANLTGQIGVLAGGKTEANERVKALQKLVNRVNKGNDKLMMTLLLNVLDPYTINENKDIIIDSFDAYEVGAEYSVGDKFKYEGKLFEVLEEHKAVVEWIPTAEPTKYKEIILQREEHDEEEIEDEANRYITKGYLDEAMSQMMNTILETLTGGEEDAGEHEGENSADLSHNEGGSTSND